MIAGAAEGLGFALNSAAGTQLVCRRGGEAIEVPGTPGSSSWDMTSGDGTVTQFKSRDFIILAADYVFGGKPVLPERGDRIEEVLNGKTLVYQAMSPDPNHQHYRFCDHAQTLLRIHTKQVTSK